MNVAGSGDKIIKTGIGETKILSVDHSVCLPGVQV